MRPGLTRVQSFAHPAHFIPSRTLVQVRVRHTGSDRQEMLSFTAQFTPSLFLPFMISLAHCCSTIDTGSFSLLFAFSLDVGHFSSTRKYFLDIVMFDKLNTHFFYRIRHLKNEANWPWGCEKMLLFVITGSVVYNYISERHIDDFDRSLKELEQELVSGGCGRGRWPL